ncbi:MAG: TatD family hydrolase [Candidatus Neomarinimicrobiota bacterium]|nr:TatD family hydrolase [Candidatus Neomarinimicrobiota bacterium]
MTLIDTHAHLYYDQMYNNLDTVLDEATENGVTKIICIGTDLNTSKQSVEIANKYKNVYAAVGIHPHDSKDVTKDYLKDLEALALSSKKVVAIGEIGIDHYRNISPKKIQEKVMIDQMELAQSLSLPIIFHNRDADNDIIEILKQHSFSRAIAHCYSSDLSFAEQLIDLNVLLSFSGNVTFKNSINQSAIQNIALKDFVLETDCPFLAPQPFRGKPNEPKYVKDIALFISDLLDIEFEEIASQTTSNAESFFKI